MLLTTAWVSRKAPVRFVERTRSQDSLDIRRIRLSSVTPALLTRTSICPSSVSARLTPLSIEAGSDRSSGRTLARPPVAAISATTFPSASTVRAAATMRAPSEASRRAIASPMPREAPVTRATRPSNRFRSSPPRIEVYATKERALAAGRWALVGRARALRQAPIAQRLFGLIHQIRQISRPGVVDRLGHVGDREHRWVIGAGGAGHRASVGQHDHHEASLLRPQDPGVVVHAPHRSTLARPEKLARKAARDSQARRIL